MSVPKFAADVTTVEVFLISFVVCLFFVKWWKEDLSNTPYPPGPRSIPLIGNLHQLGSHPHLVFTKWQEKYGDVVSFKLGPKRVVVLNGYQCIHDALIGYSLVFAGRPSSYIFENISQGNDMTSADYSPRMKLQRKLARSFLTTILRNKTASFEKLVHQEGRMICKQLIKASQGNQPTDPHFIVGQGISALSYKMCFGREESVQALEDQMYLAETADEISKFLGNGNPVDIYPWMRYIIYGKWRKFLSCTRGVVEIINKQFSSYKKGCKSGSLINEIATTITARSLNEWHKEGLNVNHVKMLLLDIMGAGTETVSTTLHWGILLLAKHKEIQDKMRTEIMETFGSSAPPTLNESRTVSYTRAVLAEIQRWASVVPLSLPHSVTRDTIFRGFFIPQGTIVFPNLWSATRDPLLWKDPEEFKPDRFLNASGELEKSLVNKAIPFSMGRRACLGKKVAEIELFVLLTTLIQNCTITMKSDQRLDTQFGLTLKPISSEVIFTEIKT